MLAPRLALNGMQDRPPVDNPLSPLPPEAYGGVVSWESWTPAAVLMGGVFVAIVASLVSMGFRYRRARGVERLQLRWLFLAVSVPPFWIACMALFDGLEQSTLGSLGVAFGLAFIPVACGIAILKHRLYEIDRIISRTVSYVLVSAAVIGTYALVVTSVTRMLPDSTDLAVAVATLAAAAVFRPVLGSVRGRVDRRFNRARYNAEHTVEAFAAQLRSGVDSQLAATELLGAVDRTLQPSSVGVWLREDPR